MLLLRNEKDWDHRKVLKKNIKGEYLIFWLNSRYNAMVRYGNLLLITNRHRIGQLDYTNANMFSLWPLDIKFFRYDVEIEKEIFGLPSQTWSRLGKKSWKTFFASSSHFLKTDIRRKCFMNIGLISSTKKFSGKTLNAFLGYRILIQRSFCH